MALKSILDFASDILKPYIDNVKIALTNETKERLRNGIHNLLPSDVSSGQSNRVSYTVNADKSITVSTESSGASAPTYIRICSTDFVLGSGDYILTGCPSGGSGSTYCLFVAGFTTTANDSGDGLDFTANSSAGYAAIFINTGTVITTPITFRPMIRAATDTNTTYEPYAMTNQQLTENKAEKSDLSSIVATGSTNNSGVGIGNGTLFYLNGELVEATETIAVNASFTLNTNYKKLSSGALNEITAFSADIIGANSLKSHADSFGSGGKIEWVEYYSNNTDAPSAYDGYAQIIYMSSSFKTIVAYSRDGKMYQLQKASGTWGTWKTITMS